MRSFVLTLCLLGLTVAPFTAFAANKSSLDDRLESSRMVLTEIMATPDQSIPNALMRQAKCVAVFPSVVKGAFVFGGEYGQGVVTCRTNHGWSAPAFIRIAGGSFGFQLGAQAVDLVIIAVNNRGFQDLLKNKFKIGAGASAAAGPVGRNAQAGTDWKMGAELLTYSRARGLFAGIDLSGAVVSQNIDDTRTFYNVAYPFKELLKGQVPVPVPAQPFVRTVAKYFTTVQ